MLPIRAALLVAWAVALAAAAPYLSDVSPHDCGRHRLDEALSEHNQTDVHHGPRPRVSTPTTLSSPPLSPHLPPPQPVPLHPRAALNNITFNYTLTDMDTILTYTPSSTGSSSLTWENTFTESSPPSSAGKSIVGRGESAHTSSMGGATIGWSFTGTGVYVIGNGSADSRIRLTTDGANADFVPAELNATDSIAWAEVTEGWHTVTLSIITGTVSVREVRVRTGMMTEAPNFTVAKRTEHLFLQGDGGGEGTLNTFYKTSGKWDKSWSVGGEDGTAAQPLPVINGQPSAAFVATVPDNTSYLLLNGTSQPLLSYYTVSLNPPIDGGPTSEQFNAQQSFCNGVAFYMAPLDPAVRYIISFSVSGNVLTGPVGVHSMTFWSALWTNDTTPTPGPTDSPESTSTSPPTDPVESVVPTKGGSNAGAIAGGVVGGVVLLGLFAAIWFLYRRRQKLTSRTPDNSSFVVDDMPEGEATPYYRMESVQSSRPSLLDPSEEGYGASLSPPPLSTMSGPLSSGALSPTTQHRSLQPQAAPTGSPRVPGAGPSVSEAAAEKRALRRRSERRIRNPTIPGEQEVDAGRVNDTVPPSYDPSWAGDYASSAGRSRSGSGTASVALAEVAAQVEGGSGGEEVVRRASTRSVLGVLEDSGMERVEGDVRGRGGEEGEMDDQVDSK